MTIKKILQLLETPFHQVKYHLGAETRNGKLLQAGWVYQYTEDEPVFFVLVEDAGSRIAYQIFDLKQIQASVLTPTND